MDNYPEGQANTNNSRLASCWRFLDRQWRIAGTGFSFAAFGIGGVLIAMLMTLIILPLPIAKQRKHHCSRWLIGNAFRAYIRMMRALGLLTFSFKNKDQLQKPGQLVLANHPSLLDVVFIISLIPQANCVVKGALWRNPFTYGPVTTAGFISNDDPDLLDKCQESLDRGESLIIFPEGTRSTPGRPLKFLRGAANIALASCLEVRPIKINCTPPTLLKNQKWYSVPHTPPLFTIETLPVLPIGQFRDATPYPSKNGRQLCRYLESYFNQAITPTPDP